VLNLTHREGHTAPEPLTPGRFYEIDLPLYLTGRRLRTGSRIRLALSESLWPLLWPSPTPVRLQIDLGASRLRLARRGSAGAEPAFAIPIVTPSPSAGRSDPEIRRELVADGRVEFDERWSPSEGRISATGTMIERSGANVEARLTPGDPNAGGWRVRQSVRYRRDDWDCEVACEVELTSTVTDFEVHERLTARRGERVVFNRDCRTVVPRDLM
jgi:uncharacterized protein